MLTQQRGGRSRTRRELELALSSRLLDTCVSVGHVADALEIKGIGDNQTGNGHDDGQKGGDEAEFLPGRPVGIEQLIGGLISDIWRVLRVGVLLDLHVASCTPKLLLFLIVDHRRDATCQACQFCGLFFLHLFWKTQFKNIIISSQLVGSHVGHSLPIIYFKRRVTQNYRQAACNTSVSLSEEKNHTELAIRRGDIWRDVFLKILIHIKRRWAFLILHAHSIPAHAKRSRSICFLSLGPCYGAR